MILLGILLGPTVLNIIDPEILTISPLLRQLALVIVLTRSGLNLDLKELNFHHEKFCFQIQYVHLDYLVKYSSQLQHIHL